MLSREEIVEEGIVESAGKGIVTVKIIPKGGCEECSAKVFCSSGNDKNIVSATDNYGAVKGDHVRISVPGRNITSASTLIYGIPLLLLITGIIAGQFIFHEQKEVLSAALSFVLIALYGGIIYLSSSRKEYSSLMPRVISISKK